MDSYDYFVVTNDDFLMFDTQQNYYRFFSILNSSFIHFVNVFSAINCSVHKLIIILHGFVIQHVARACVHYHVMSIN